MNDLLELAERCEAAMGSDRALDGFIFAAITPDAKIINHCYIIDKMGFCAPVLAFTTSIDAALTLVPDRMDWMLCRAHDHSEGGKAYFYASIEEPQVHYAATPALALCAAALRARAAISKDHP